MRPTDLGATGDATHTGGRMASHHTWFAYRHWWSTQSIASEVGRPPEGSVSRVLLRLDRQREQARGVGLQDTFLSQESGLTAWHCEACFRPTCRHGEGCRQACAAGRAPRHPWCLRSLSEAAQLQPAEQGLPITGRPLTLVVTNHSLLRSLLHSALRSGWSLTSQS